MKVKSLKDISSVKELKEELLRVGESSCNGCLFLGCCIHAGQEFSSVGYSSIKSFDALKKHKDQVEREILRRKYMGEYQAHKEKCLKGKDKL